MLRDLPAIRRDPLAYLERVVARYGDLVAFPMPRTPALLVDDPAGVRRVLVENPRAWSKRTVQYGSLSAVTGSGLLTADGDPWRRRRRLVQPAFHHGSLDVVAEQSAAVARALLAGWTAPGAGGGGAGRVVDVDDAVMQATLEVVARTLFAADLGAEGERVVAAVLAALEVVVARARTPVPPWLPVPSRARLRRAVRTIDDAVAGLVAARRRRGVRDDDADLLGLLLRAADAADLTAQEVRDELVTMVIAGHETVATSLSWTLRLLAEHPDVQGAVRAELAGALGGRAAGWGDLPALRLTRAVVDEALRLYPPAWVLTRRAEQPDEVAGVAVPAGTLVVISPWLLHRRPQAWEDPERFDPQRFLGERAATPRPDYLPFGVGPRLCIGRDMALVESVLVLATLLPAVRLEPVPGTRRPAADALVTLRPRGGMPLLVRPTASGGGS